ncbi:MAG: diaminopimelate decarboxylase [Candidatus Omnitrophica bacterium]|nr:diaminopimelate decarboxylase [Candidatus Omnitrophota bacterium]
MHEFKYIGNELHCETVKISDIAKKVDTPFYLYSYKTLLDHYYKLKKAFSSINPLICFSMKANSNLAVLRALIKEGAGLDIVSGGELYKALRIGANPKRIVYASVGKTDKEIREAIKNKILLFNVESVPELDLINTVAQKLKRKVDVSLRINPGVEVDTHNFIATARQDNKFGLDLDTVKFLFSNLKRMSNVNLIGVHIHIGSQITESHPFIEAINIISSFVDELKKDGVRLKYFNIGGGLGIIYREETPQTAQGFAKAVLPYLKKLRLKIILEPGRFICGNAGILVTGVLYIKDTRFKRFIIVDAGMNDLIRPALYDAYHEILPIVESKFKSQNLEKADIVGPICESADFLAKERPMPRLESGDLLAVMGAGAYGFSMSSNYNSRPRCAEVMVIRGKFYVVKKAESYKDLVKGEIIPKVLR